MTVLLLIVIVLGVYLTAYAAYQTMLLLANVFISDSPGFEPSRKRIFNVFVPAHNEELHLPRLLASLRSQVYPPDKYRISVIADNCTDGTVAVCKTFDVDVYERVEPEHRGKGYAIGWTLERLDLTGTDAIVIIDGDSLADPHFLMHLNLQMERGDSVIQCYNGVANPGQSWFTRLMNVSRTIANEVLHPGKRKLGLSSHLMGNGMCFDVAVLRSFGWNAFSVGEDWEYYARLVLSGAHVGYSRQSRVYHQESVNLQQASSQRRRWSSGRFEVLRRYGPSLFFTGIRTGNLKCLDAALPLVFPNPSLGMNMTSLGLALAALYWFFSPGGTGLVAWFVALAFLQFVMFMVGVRYTEDRVASALSLFLAPVFLVWKFGIDITSVFGVGTKQWKPTERRLS
jgi:1,2-diacylglycerol 3-beta-glucosyltransferase